MVRGIVAGMAVAGSVGFGVVGHAAQAKPAAPPSQRRCEGAEESGRGRRRLSRGGEGRVREVLPCCHGAEGKGDGPGAAMMKDVKPANLTDAKWDHGSTDGEIFTTIHDGIGPKFDMDSWEGRIQDTDIWNMVNYIKTLVAKTRRSSHWGLLRLIPVSTNF